MNAGSCSVCFTISERHPKSLTFASLRWTWSALTLLDHKTRLDRSPSVRLAGRNTLHSSTNNHYSVLRWFWMYFAPCLANHFIGEAFFSDLKLEKGNWPPNVEHLCSLYISRQYLHVLKSWKCIRDAMCIAVFKNHIELKMVMACQMNDVQRFFPAITCVRSVYVLAGLLSEYCLVTAQVDVHVLFKPGHYDLLYPGFRKCMVTWADFFADFTRHVFLVVCRGSRMTSSEPHLRANHCAWIHQLAWNCNDRELHRANERSVADIAWPWRRCYSQYL